MTDAKWFKRLAGCAGTKSKTNPARCGRPSVGVLMSARNEEIGARCERCAGRALEGVKVAHDLGPVLYGPQGRLNRLRGEV